MTTPTYYIHHPLLHSESGGRVSRFVAMVRESGAHNVHDKALAHIADDAVEVCNEIGLGGVSVTASIELGVASSRAVCLAEDVVALQAEVAQLRDAPVQRIVACVNALAGVEDPAAAVKAAREALRQLEFSEWADGGPACPRCLGRPAVSGHSARCSLGKALRMLTPKEGKR